MKKRKLLALVLALGVLLGTAMPTSVVEAIEAEDIAPARLGEEAETAEYIEIIFIETAEDLVALAENCRLDSWSLGRKVVLLGDISLEGISFEPIPTFAGVFEGNGYTISGFYLTDTMTPAGFFGQLQSTGVVQNLTVSGTVMPTGDAQFVGGLVGENHGTLTGCTFTGSVAGASSTGGIAGINGLTGSILNCSVGGMVTGEDMTGGIAGCNLGSISSCVNRASVNTQSSDPSVNLEDIQLDFLTDISKLTSLDVSSAAVDTGGISGYSSGIVKDCTNKAPIGYPHVGYNVGGIVGRSCGYVASCTNTAEIYGRKDVGGIAGQMEPYMVKNLTESELVKLEQELSELDDLVTTALEHASGASSTLTNRLNGIASSIGSAASAAKNIHTTGTLSSSVAGSIDSSVDGGVTVTPVEGEIGGGVHVEDGSITGGGIEMGDGSIAGGGIHVGEGSISAGVGGSLSSGVEGEGSASIGAGLDVQTQISISTNLSGLSAALSSMAGQMHLLSGELGSASEEMLADVALMQSKVNAMVEEGFDLLLREEDDTVVDTSTTVNIDTITLGKVHDCTNASAVNGDINVGGIAGNMGLEYAIDPEDNLHLQADNATKQQYEVRAVIQSCTNTGAVQAKRNYAGGIVGKMDLGLVAQCQSYGSVSSESGHYVGGIAGICSSTIRYCFAKCTLSGGNYIGGIVGSGVEETKTGSSSTVAGCYAMVNVGEHGQYTGAISGAYAGTFLENYFVTGELSGINGMSYANCAQPLSYEAFLGNFQEAETELPDPFKTLTLQFVAEGKVLYSQSFAYGASFSDTVFPDIPQKEGYYAYWDRAELKNLQFDTTVTAVYEPCISALSSGEERSGGHPIFFVEGDFGAEDTLTAVPMALTPEAFQLPTGLWDAIGKSLTEGKVNTEVVEQWQVSILGDAGTAHTLRYLPPKGDAGHMGVYALTEGTWRELETEVIGSYVTFSMDENQAQIAIVHRQNTWWAWLLVGVLLLALVIVFLCLLGKKRKSPKAPVTEEVAEEGEIEPVEEEKAQADPASQKRRWLTPLLVVAALLVEALAAGAFFLLPELLAGKGAYDILTAYVNEETLSMTLQVEAEVGNTSFPLTVGIQRTSVNGQRVTCICQEGRTLYYGNSRVILENGNSYGMGDTLPEYSALLDQAVEAYRYVEVEEVNGTYSITATGEDAKAFLKLLLPTMATEISDTDTVSIRLVTKDNALSQIQISGSGNLKDEASTAYRVKGVLQVLSVPDSVEIPQAVQAALRAEEEVGQVLSEEILVLAEGWHNLNSREFYAAETTLKVDCGPLELKEELILCRWLEEGIAVYSLQENGYGLYASEKGICDGNGTMISYDTASNVGMTMDTVDVEKLMELLYSLCIHGSVDWVQTGEIYAYTLSLDAEGMGAVAQAMVPEIEKLQAVFTSGTVCVVVNQAELERIEICIGGSVEGLLTKAEATIEATLDFAGGKELALPERVKEALIQTH